MDTQELLKRILEDYNSFCQDKDAEATSRERAKSFIYKYFLAEKRRETAKFIERETDFYRGLQTLVKGVKIESAADLARISDKNVTVRDNYLLLAISRKAFEYGWISENELKAVIMKTRKVKKIPPVLLRRESAEYNAAWERCLRILLQKTICDFFNSKGFIVNDSGLNNPAGRFSTKKRGRDERKERDLVHLYHQYNNYCEQKKQPQKNSRARYSGGKTSLVDYKERAKDLLRAITDDVNNSKKYKHVIIPIYFDAKVGAGIYLIGEDCFEPAAFDKSGCARESVCVPCIVSFYTAVLDNQDRFVYLNRLANGSSPIKAGFEMDVEPFATLDKAFETFAYLLRKNAFGIKFSLCNMSRCPPQINDEVFKRILG